MPTLPCVRVHGCCIACMPSLCSCQSMAKLLLRSDLPWTCIARQVRYCGQCLLSGAVLGSVSFKQQPWPVSTQSVQARGANVHGTCHDAWQGYLASGYLRSCELQQAKCAAPRDAIACMAAVLDCMCWRIAASASRPSKSRPLLHDVCTAAPHLCHLAHVGSMGIL
jgi:hypothetical protein